MSVETVSIVVPCYNAAPWLETTLTSIFAQTHRPIEVIVVDDGSKDGSAEIARRFGDRGAKVIEQSNRGASAARNVGLRLSTGSYIQFLDADDLLAPDKIARQLELAEKLGADFAYCGAWSRFRQSPADADFTPQPLCCDATPVEWLIVKLEQHRMMHPGAWLCHRSLLDRAGPWDESLSLDDDGEYFSRVVLASRGVRVCVGAVSYYRSQIDGSLSRTKTERGYESAWRAIDQTANALLQREDSPRTRHACATAAQRFIYESYPHAAVWRRAAEKRVAALGGSELLPDGGPKFQAVRRLLGWRTAKRLQGLIE